MKKVNHVKNISRLMSIALTLSVLIQSQAQAAILRRFWVPKSEQKAVIEPTETAANEKTEVKVDEDSVEATKTSAETDNEFAKEFGSFEEDAPRSPSAEPAVTDAPATEVAASPAEKPAEKEAETKAVVEEKSEEEKVAEVDSSKSSENLTQYLHDLIKDEKELKEAMSGYSIADVRNGKLGIDLKKIAEGLKGKSRSVLFNSKGEGKLSVFMTEGGISYEKPSSTKNFCELELKVTVENGKNKLAQKFSLERYVTLLEKKNPSALKSISELSSSSVEIGKTDMLRTAIALAPSLQPTEQSTNFFRELVADESIGKLPIRPTKLNCEIDGDATLEHLAKVSSSAITLSPAIEVVDDIFGEEETLVADASTAAPALTEAPQLIDNVVVPVSSNAEFSENFIKQLEPKNPELPVMEAPAAPAEPVVSTVAKNEATTEGAATK